MTLTLTYISHISYAFHVTCPYNPPCSDLHNNVWGRVQITYFCVCSCYFEDVA